jgi:hypothetical protein
VKRSAGRCRLECWLSSSSRFVREISEKSWGGFPNAAHIGTEHDLIFTDQLERLAQVLVFFAAQSTKSGHPLFFRFER